MVARFFRRSVFLTRVSRWFFPLVARIPFLRRFAFRGYVARPERLSAENSLALMHGALGCAVASHVLDLAASDVAGFGDLGPIPCPVRVLYGTKDKIIRWPSHYHRLRKVLPQAEFIALDGLGHLAMWDDPEIVSARVLEITSR